MTPQNLFKIINHSLNQLLFNVKWSLIRWFHTLRTKFIRGWKRGIVNENRDHIKIFYENTILALIGPGQNNNVIVEFKHHPDDVNIQALVEKQKGLLNSLFDRDMPMKSRWEYALYHCGTTSNVYSKVNTSVFWCSCTSRNESWCTQQSKRKWVL